MNNNLAERPLRSITIESLFTSDRWRDRYVARTRTGIWWHVPRDPDPDATCANITSKALSHIGLSPMDELATRRYIVRLEALVRESSNASLEEVLQIVARDAVDLVFALRSDDPPQAVRFKLMERHPKVRPSLCDLAVDAANGYRMLSRLDARIAVFGVLAARAQQHGS